SSLMASMMFLASPSPNRSATLATSLCSYTSSRKNPLAKMTNTILPHVSREGRNVGDVDLPPAERLRRQSDGEPDAADGQQRWAERAEAVAEPGKVFGHRAGVLGESRAAEGKQQNAREQDTHVATLPFEEAHRLGFPKGPRRFGPTSPYRRVAKASVKRLTLNIMSQARRRNNMWLQGRLRLLPLAQHLRPQRQRAAQPDGVLGMIGVGVAGAGVEQNAQALMIEHQPRQERGQQCGRESKLIHRLRMRSDRRVVPSPKRHIREGRRHMFA